MYSNARLLQDYLYAEPNTYILHIVDIHINISNHQATSCCNDPSSVFIHRILIFSLNVSQHLESTILQEGVMQKNVTKKPMFNKTKSSCRTVALRKKKMLTDRIATVPPIVKTVYLLRTKSCARF